MIFMGPESSRPRPEASTLCCRSGQKSTPIPAARALEDDVLPQVDDIVAAALDCF
jgi:hypothetical protein